MLEENLFLFEANLNVLFFIFYKLLADYFLESVHFLSLCIDSVSLFFNELVLFTHCFFKLSKSFLQFAHLWLQLLSLWKLFFFELTYLVLLMLNFDFSDSQCCFEFAKCFMLVNDLLLLLCCLILEACYLIWLLRRKVDQCMACFIDIS